MADYLLPAMLFKSSGCIAGTGASPIILTPALANFKQAMYFPRHWLSSMSYARLECPVTLQSWQKLQSYKSLVGFPLSGRCSMD